MALRAELIGRLGLFDRLGPVQPLRPVGREGEASTPIHPGRLAAQIWHAYQEGRPEEATRLLVEGRGEGVDLIARDEAAAKRTIRELAPLGLDLGSAILPGQTIPPWLADTRHNTYAHWITVSRPSSPHLLPPPLTEPEFPSLPPEVTVNGESFKGESVLRTMVLKPDFFGQPLPLVALIRALQPEIPSLELAILAITQGADGLVKIKGAIADTDKGKMVATFVRLLPRVPQWGKPWIAGAAGFTSRPESFGDHRKRGIARAHHQRLFTFLAHLGVDRFEMGADENGSYVWPHIGFDFRGPSTRWKLLNEFDKWVGGVEKKLSPAEREEFAEIRHAWQLADFSETSGKNWGKRFLLLRGNQTRQPRGHEGLRPWKVSFHFRSDYPGWSRLFKRAEC